jgi:hypothetical protein
MQYDPRTICKALPGINPASYTVGQTGPVIDARGYEYALIVMHFGALNDSAALAIKVQDDPASGGSYTDITGAIYNATEAGGSADDNTIKVGLVRLHGKQRYLRVVSTAGTADACVYGVQVILFHADYTKALEQTFSFNVT